MSDHHGHDHGVGADTEIRPLATALVLILAFMVAEVALGLVADSLALLSDAAHMLVDAAALGLSVWAARLARRPAGGLMTFGFRRAEILSAQVNGATLLILGLVIVVEGIRRLIDPPDVHAPIVVATAVVGAIVNVIALRQVARANRANLNVEGSYRHLLTDLYAFAATALAGVVIWVTGFDRADAIASLAVAASMLAAAWPLLRASGRVLLEAAPGGDRPERGRRHAAHARGGDGCARPAHLGDQLGLPGALRARPRRTGRGLPPDPPRARGGSSATHYAIEHTTLQVEHTSDRLLSIEPLRTSREDR